MIETDLKQFKSYLEAKGRSQNTIKNYEVGVEQFLKYVNKQPKDITIQDIETYCRYIRSKVHSNTLTSKYCSVKAYLKFLKRKDLLTECEDEDLLKPPIWKLPEKEILTKSEIQSMFQTSKDNPRDNAILKTLYYSTQRVSSIRDLKLSDINFDNEAVRIHAKGDRYYSVDLHSEAIQSIKTYLKVRPDPQEGFEEKLFLSEWGKGLSRARIWQMVKDYAYKSGITKRVYPHLFRASAITHMDNSGMSLSQIKLQSGHQDIKSLNTYIRPDKKQVKAKVRNALNLDKSIEPEQPPKKPDIPTQPNVNKSVDKSTNTDNLIASLQNEIEHLKAQLRDRENGYMYG